MILYNSINSKRRGIHPRISVVGQFLYAYEYHINSHSFVTTSIVIYKHNKRIFANNGVYLGAVMEFK